ncbi:CAIB/BAIF family enzyme [Mycena latifolia]|nr:CAIB/BAIF family enzyme [Mycena latifolia]
MYPLLLSIRLTARTLTGSYLNFHKLPRRRFLTTTTTTTQDETPSCPLPLDGVTLADFGARVIKIERRDGGDFARNYDTRVYGLASHFVWTNRSKESLALDLKDPRDMAVLHKLLAKADHEHPGLVVCNISGYGPDGPYRDKKAYDLLVQSEAGMLSVTGRRGWVAGQGRGCRLQILRRACMRTRTSSEQLMKRDKTGKGSNINISMLEAMVEWMGFPLYYTFDGAAGPTPSGAAHASIYPYGPFATGRGGDVMLGVQNEREWARLCSDVLGDAELASDKRFETGDFALAEPGRVEEHYGRGVWALGCGEVLERLDKAGIANARVNDMQDVWEHAQLQGEGTLD